MIRLRCIISFLAIFPLALSLFASGEPDEAANKRFGPYEALTFDSKILRDVKYDADTGNVYLQLLPDHKEKELRVKLSTEYFGGYRKWFHGEYELVSPANQGKEPYGWTDHVNTTATYIEYWMDGEVFLHLKKVN